MPQVIVNNSEIEVFSFTVKFDIRNLSIVFDISDTVFNGTGVSTCEGINFSVVDSGGVTQHTYDWNNPDIPVPSTTENPQYLGESTYTLDLSDTFIYGLFFQKWRIKGAIRDGNGTTFETSVSVYDLCMPEGFTDYGYVKGTFHIKLDCPNATVTVKDLTVPVYRKEEPYESTNDGVLYYPVGTVDPVTFTATPFSNNVVYTGNYRLVNTLTALFDLGNGGSIQVEYYTAENWDFDCENNISNVLCCIQDLQITADKNCNNPVGKDAKQQLLDISPFLMTGIIKEMRGQDSSYESKYIREKLRCNCGKQGVRKVSADPVNAAVYDIVITGTGGTAVTSSISGNTKNYVVNSRIYQVTKGDLNDEAFTISIDTQTPNITKYVLTFDYEVMAEYILTEISNNQTLITQLNSLVNNNFIDLTNLNGRCVIDIDAANFFLSFRVASSSNTVNYITFVDGEPIEILSGSVNPPVSNPVAIENALNALGFGTFEVSYSSSASGTFINVLSVGNSFLPESMTFGVASEVVVRFQQTNVSLIAVLQALVDYMCDITAAQVQLGEALTICSYTGETETDTSLSASALQSDFNAAIALAICAIRDRVASVTTTTCAAIQALFLDRPSSVADGSARFYGINADEECTAWTLRQLALGIISTIRTDSTVFNAFCAIPDCGEPTACPDIIGATVIQLGNAIVLQSVDLDAFTDTTQTVTVRYRLQGDPSYTTVTAALTVQADGTVTPNLTVLENPTIGEIYEVYVVNNCGGGGYVSTIEIAVCPDPENLTVTFLDETSPGVTYSATVAWDGDATGEYNVAYRVVGDTSWITPTGSPVTGLSLVIDDLEYSVEYEFEVQRQCDTSSASEWVSTTFEEVYSNAEFNNLSGSASVFFVDAAVDALYGFFDCALSPTPFPLADTETATCVQLGFTGVVTVKATVPSGDYNAKLYKNDVEVECIDLTVGTEQETSFASTTFAAGDELRIDINAGLCVPV